MDIETAASGPPLLYSYRRCPYAMRARMALLQAGVAFCVHDIVLRDKPPRMLALSPKGTVPVLVLPDGAVLEQSMDIMAWAFARHDPGAWWPRAQTPALQRLLALCDGPFKRELDRTKYPERHGLADRSAPRADAAELLLRPLEAVLSTQPHLGGDTPCASDTAIVPFVRQFAAIDPHWWAQQPWPHLQRWLSQWLASPLLQAAMAKTPSNTVVPFPALTT